MVSVGSLSIKGTIDTGEIDRGLLRIEGSLQNVQAQTNSTFGSFSNLAQVTKSVASSFVKIATVGVGAMTALASVSPAVAPAMARISMAMREISFAMGDKLAPLFESVANDLIPAIGSAIERFTPQINNMVSIGVEGINDISSALKGNWSEISNIIPKTAGVATGIALGSKFGLQGMLLGAALGYVAGDAFGTTPEAYEEAKFGMDKTAVALEETQGDTSMSGLIDTFVKPMGGVKLVGAGAKVITAGIIDLLEFVFSSMTDKDRAFAGTERT